VPTDEYNARFSEKCAQLRDKGWPEMHVESQARASLRFIGEVRRGRQRDRVHGRYSREFMSESEKATIDEINWNAAFEQQFPCLRPKW
jgi:hypothetical protein